MVPPARPVVAIDATPLLGTRTGIGVATAALVDALATTPDGPTLVPYALSLRARLQGRALPPGTRHVPIPARVLLRAWARGDRPGIDRWLRPATVLHATNYLAPPSRLPTVVTVWDLTMLRYPELVSDAVAAMLPVLRRAVGRGATLHTGTEAIASDIEEAFGPGLRASGRLVVIPPGPPSPGPDGPVSDAVATLLDGRPFVLALGTVEPRKALPELVHAFGAVAASCPGLHLVHAGPDGPDGPALDEARDALPPATRPSVHLLGPVTEADKGALLRRATLLAYPSRYEGYGFPALEAMAVGTPVVTTATGSLPEVVGDAALLVPPGDRDALADGIATLVHDAPRRAALVARGHERIATLSWAASARAMGRLYERLAAGG